MSCTISHNEVIIALLQCAIHCLDAIRSRKTCWMCIVAEIQKLYSGGDTVINEKAREK